MKITVRRVFSILVAAPLFVSLAWFFGVFLQPQGAAGAGFALTLILVSAVASIVVYSWLASPGPKVRFRDKGVDGMDRDWGVGLMGASQHQTGRRRRDETDGEDFGSSRGSRQSDADTDTDVDDGSVA